MPTVTVTMREGLDRAGKKLLIEKVTDVVVEVTQVPKEAVHIIIDEKSTDNFGDAGIQLTEKIEARAKAAAGK